MSQKSTKYKKIVFGSSPSLKEHDKHPPKISFNSSDINHSKQCNELTYLQPEILPLEVMKKLLKVRGASEVILTKEGDARSFIIKLFYKHITPKPQREYKLNRLGKILMKMRCRREKGKEKNEWESLVLAETSKSSSDGHSSFRASSKNLSSSPSSSCDRLKLVPSSCINLERKKIKLSSSSSSSPIKRNLVTEGEDHEVKSIKKITLDSHVSARKIKLKSTNLLDSKSEEKLQTSNKIKISTGLPVKESLIENKEKIKISGSPVKRESDSSGPDTKRKKSIAWP